MTSLQRAEAAEHAMSQELDRIDPTVRVELEECTDIVGRHFKQPKEGLGFDHSSSAHMWRTMNWPTRYL